MSVFQQSRTILNNMKTLEQIDKEFTKLKEDKDKFTKASQEIEQELLRLQGEYRLVKSIEDEKVEPMVAPEVEETFQKKL